MPPVRPGPAAAAGIGTILATATIHMLAPASEALSNPCLPAAWREAYGPWAFLFATAAMMAMHLVDYLVKVGRAREVNLVLCGKYGRCCGALAGLARPCWRMV